jgi:P27 family predicted phage terminase small subunit
MARPRKVVGISTGKIGKQAKMNREVQENQLKLSRKNLESGAPEWLSDIAAVEYNRVVYEAGKINLLDNLDLAVLAIYADNYSTYIESAEAIQESGTVTMGKFGPAASPYIMIRDKAATQILKCSAKLGLATTDRLKLIVPTKEEKSVNKFLKYLDG